MKLNIKKGGLIFRDNDKEIKEVTDSAPFFLMESCTLDDDVTLKDIFLILQRDMDIYEVIINNYVKEIVEEGLSETPFEEVEGDCKIDYLQLSWKLTAETGKEPDFYGGLFPMFDGWGSYGEDVNWPTPPDYKGLIGVDFTPSYELINYPLKLNDTLDLIIENNYRPRYTNGTDPDTNVKTFKKPQYSLFHILYGIIWELSFFGDPTKRDENPVLNQIKNHHLNKEKLVELTVDATPCPNCKETNEVCACLRNICLRCGESVGNITFTVCNSCWDIEHPK